MVSERLILNGTHPWTGSVQTGYAIPRRDTAGGTEAGPRTEPQCLHAEIGWLRWAEGLGRRARQMKTGSRRVP